MDKWFPLQIGLWFEDISRVIIFRLITLPLRSMSFKALKVFNYFIWSVVGWVLWNYNQFSLSWSSSGISWVWQFLVAIFIWGNSIQFIESMQKKVNIWKKTKTIDLVISNKSNWLRVVWYYFSLLAEIQ